MYYTYTQTPAGTLLLTGDGAEVTGMHWQVFKRAPLIGEDWVEDPSVFTTVTRQLSEYFAGQRTAFDIPYHLGGTPFQKAVWAQLAAIPYGSSTTYQAIARAIGRPAAVRAVGTAVGSNPISIVVPCHRVLPVSGKVGGYAGGAASKELLLQIEKIAYRGAAE